MNTTTTPFAFLKEQHTNVFQEKIIQSLDYLGVDIQRVSPSGGPHEELSILLPGSIAELNRLAQDKNLPDFASAFSNLAHVELKEQGNSLVELRLSSKSYVPTGPKF